MRDFAFLAAVFYKRRLDLVRGQAALGAEQLLKAEKVVLCNSAAVLVAVHPQSAARANLGGGVLANPLEGR